MPVELCITFKGETIAKAEKVNSLKEAVAYLWGLAVNGGLSTADSVSIYPTGD